MKRMLLIFLLIPTNIFCMDDHEASALAESLKQELNKLLNGAKKEQSDSTKVNLHDALQSAFGRFGKTHIRQGCFNLIQYPIAQADQESQTYAQGFLDGVKPEREYERIMCYILRGRLQINKKIKSKL